MIWDNIIQTYDREIDQARICPVAHTKIVADIAIMLDEQSRILAAAKVKQSIFAPCTAKSECRSSNIAPHLIHDNASYVTSINENRHNAYMQQLDNYVSATDDPFAKIVLKYLSADTLIHDLQYLVDLKSNQKLVITFGIKGWEENTISHSWANYYISQLPKNGICAITKQPDYIPDSYPGGLRYPGDMAKLFCAKKDDLDGMPRLRAGYIASQKIIHTLQSFLSNWSEQETIPISDIVIGTMNDEE